MKTKHRMFGEQITAKLGLFVLPMNLIWQYMYFTDGLKPFFKSTSPNKYISGWKPASTMPPELDSQCQKVKIDRVLSVEKINSKRHFLILPKGA